MYFGFSRRRRKEIESQSEHAIGCFYFLFPRRSSMLRTRPHDLGLSWSNFLLVTHQLPHDNVARLNSTAVQWVHFTKNRNKTRLATWVFLLWVLYQDKSTDCWVGGWMDGWWIETDGSDRVIDSCTQWNTIYTILSAQQTPLSIHSRTDDRRTVLKTNVKTYLITWYVSNKSV